DGPDSEFAAQRQVEQASEAAGGSGNQALRPDDGTGGARGDGRPGSGAVPSARRSDREHAARARRLAAQIAAIEADIARWEEEKQRWEAALADPVLYPDGSRARDARPSPLA